MDDALLSKFQGCFCGVVIGDAMGMPVETMTPKEILYATDGKGVAEFRDGIQTRWDDLKSFRAGQTTDDWQLTKATAKSIIAKGKFDTLQCALEHITEYKETTVGWGKSTKEAIKMCANWFNNCDDKDDRKLTIGDINTISALASLNSLGAGNGVAMKVAPLALFFKAPALVFPNVVRLGKLTHKDPRAWYSAYAVSTMISKALQMEITEGSAHNFLRFIIDELLTIELDPRKGKVKCDEEPLVNQFTKILSMELLDDPIKLREVIGTGCFCVESVPFAIATALRHPQDFHSGILEAVNAGGDTDTNASMVGAIIGANVGVEGIPKEWIDAAPACQEAIELANQLYEVSK